MDEKEFDYMNVIPLVDIMLVLLTIVLTTSTFIATGVVPVKLPKATQTKVEVLKSQIIEIDQQEQIFFNARQVTLSSLEEALGAVEKTTPILIRADHRIALQGFVDVLDLLKNLGFGQMSLQTEQNL